MTSYQQRLFDGYTVDRERGTIGSFQIEDEDIKHFQADEVLVMVVTATVAGGAYKHDTSGDWVRTNKLVAHQVRVTSGVMKEEIVEFYNLGGDQLFLGSSSAPRSSTGTGSTHVQPIVASAGNTGGDPDDDEEDEPDQDFPPAAASSGNGPMPRDQALASFLEEPA